MTTVGVGLTNTGLLSVDGFSTGGSGGSSLSVGGAITNSAGATFEVGSNSRITAAMAVQATSLSNAGEIDLNGTGATTAAALRLAGGLTNTGNIVIDDATPTGGSTGPSAAPWTTTAAVSASATSGSLHRRR